MIFEGAISVKAIINSHKRKVDVVYIDENKKTKDFNYLRKRCKQEDIELIETSRVKLNEIATSKSFGGILCDASKRMEDNFEVGDIFYIDGIEDPFNLGYAFRTLYALGIKNVLLSKRDYSLMESQLLKSSAGAYEFMNIKILEDEDELKEYKAQGYYFYGLSRNDNSVDIFKEAFKEKALFILGGEKRGISAEVLKLVDKCLFIPYGSDFRNSLNACAALDVVATLLFERRRYD